MSTLISSLKETAQSLTAIRRPWRDFLDITAVDLPSSFSDATTRIAQNLTHFRLNYTIILLLIFFIALIYHPLSILTFLVILLAWFFLYFARDREEPVVIFGFTIDDRLVIAALFVLTVAGLVLTGVWLNVLVAALIGVSFVVLHAALRSTDDLVMDDLESPYGHVLAGGDEELDSPRGDYSGI
ncbi:Prenylated rab acceptor PRA1 [Corchorus olitorius]|uniref:PRA1 family protein n=1 Tax=Corchorus olitorius TaxID=93759 RepID=A0A1R3JL52_9ROSI|nr:Prenylated rab acceptor PRA1 [Corchorus olitorius]